MRVLVAGSGGVIGRQLVPMLRDEGHEVVGPAPTADSAVVKVITADALDRDAVLRAIRAIRPGAIVGTGNLVAATAWTARS